MSTTATAGVCLDVTKVINAVLRGIKHRGLPASIDPDDLRQEAEIAVWLSGETEPAALIAKIARDAMRDYMRDVNRANRDMESLELSADGSVVDNPPSDPFFTLPVDDYRPKRQREKDGPIHTLASRHAEWERERAAFWGTK